MIFGKDRERGIRMNRMRPEVVAVADVDESELLRHDKHNPVLAHLLAHMTPPEFPTPIGVLYQAERAPYEVGVRAQVDARAGTSRRGRPRPSSCTAATSGR